MVNSHYKSANSEVLLAQFQPNKKQTKTKENSQEYPHVVETEQK